MASGKVPDWKLRVGSMPAALVMGKVDARAARAVELKIDGVAASLIYEDGVLARVREWTDVFGWLRLVTVLRLAGSPTAIGPSCCCQASLSV